MTNKKPLTKEEKIARLQERIKRQKSRINKILSVDKKNERKERARALIQLGAKCFGEKWKEVSPIVLEAKKIEIFIDGKKI